MRSHWLVRLLMVLGLLLAGCQGTGGMSLLTPEPIPVRTDRLRLLWITGYPLDDPRTTQLQVGLREYLGAQGYGIPYGNLQLETYYLASAPSLPAAVADVQAFAPDIAVVSGDEAVQTFIPAYPDPTLPFVYCGLHGDPAVYHVDLPNVTGVLARPRITETLRLAHAFLPEAQRFMLLTAADGEAAILVESLQQQSEALGLFVTAPQVRLPESWEAWQQVVLAESALVDFIVVADYHTLRDTSGVLVRSRDVLQWTVENSPSPVFGLWQQTIIDGAVGGLTLSLPQQGAAAAARVIHIVAGASPAALPPAPPPHNLLSVNLAAASRWGLQIPLELVLAAQIEALSRFQGGP